MGTLTRHVEGQAATVWPLVPLAGTLGPSAGPPEQVKQGLRARLLSSGILLWLLLDLGQGICLSEPSREKEYGVE